MAGKSTISITFKLDGDGKGFTALTKDADGLKKALSETVSEAQKLNSRAINFAAIATGIDQAQQSIAQLQNVMKGLTDAYQVQETAEKQLETVMRQRMGASADDIQAIKELASAQQELGVIGDEVQLAGAQQVATYLTQRSSIETLLPAMNNLLAQQRGLTATSGDAISVAKLMGKAMRGQTAELREVGIMFNEGQEHVLKYGDETQRAAMLAEIITQNVGDMNAELARTDSGKQKQLENTLGDIKEQLGSLVSGAMPFVTITANVMLALTGVMKFSAGVKVAAAAVASWNIKTRAATVLLRLSGLTAKQTAAAVNILSSSHKSAAVSAALLKGALRGLLISTGIGIAIAAVTAIIEHFVNATDEASKKINKLIDAEERARAEAERVDNLRRQETSTLEQARAAFEINIERLRTFSGTQAQAKKLVAEMNDAYGESMGYFSSVEQWYQALIDNSEAYCRQMVIEARTRTLANQIAQAEQENHDILYDEAGNRRLYSTQRQTRTVTVRKKRTAFDLARDSRLPGPYTRQTVEVQGTSDLDKANAALAENRAKIDSWRQQMHQLVEEAAGISFSGLGKDPSDDDTTPKKTRLQEINAALTENAQRYVDASEEERAAIRATNAELRAERREIERLQQEASRPTELRTLQDVADMRAYLQNVRKNASAEELAALDAQIASLDEVEAAMERAAHVPVPVENITSYKQLNDEIKYYTQLLQTASETERVVYQSRLNQLREVQKEMDAQLARLSAPGSIDTLNTTSQLDDALSYYRNLQKNASADEVADIQRTIDAIERKNAAMGRGIDLVKMRSQVDSISQLQGREFKIKIQAIGFDELTDKITDLQKQLNDLENPVTEKQRAEMESLIGVYEEWRRQLVTSFDSFRDGYSGLRSMGDGVQSLSTALEGNGNAWQKVTAIIDGFLQIYDGIQSVIKIIDMLTIATTAHTAAKVAETGSEVAGAATLAATTTENLVASTAQTAANEVETASWSQLAAAKFFAAHASIPFAGFGIAAGFVAAQKALIAAAGIPAFAEGGLAYGPTLGIFGEYAGASTNPEVVAPLDKLRGLMQPGAVVVRGTLRAKGRDLVCVLENETRIAASSGKSTKIQL